MNTEHPDALISSAAISSSEMTRNYVPACLVQTQKTEKIVSFQCVIFAQYSIDQGMLVNAKYADLSRKQHRNRQWFNASFSSTI